MKLRLPPVVLVELVTLVMFTTECAQPKTNLKSAPAALRVTPPETQSSQARLDQHLADLKKRLPSKEFTIVVEPPFVVVGDEPAQVVKERSEDTVRWAVDRLKKDYFSKDPEEILDVWLFKDSVSYVNHTQSLWGERPGTPYGYYSRQHKALVMNISTGAGTLVHELVHPFIEANFPACPSWLNEGLGSLYEKCGEEGGHIHGYVNWRLAGLQRTIKTGSLPSFQELMAMDTGTFYADKSGTNYAQARYLCYYLQEHDLLVHFHREFVANAKLDRTGVATLRKVLKVDDLESFRAKWQAFILKIRNP